MHRLFSLALRRPAFTSAALALTLAMGCSAQSPYPYRPSEPTPQISPNTVRIEAVVEGCTASSEGVWQCRLDAKRVILYGRGGRVTPPNSPLDAEFSRGQLGIVRAPETGARIDVLIQRTEAPGDPESLQAASLYRYLPPSR